MLQIVKDNNIFNSKTQTIVNTINCVGAMGTGIALEYKKRYPEMYLKYNELCNNKQMQIGKLWLYKTHNKWILNFPTKDHWKNSSKIEYLELGLQKFIDTYKTKGITSIAFPLLGANNGHIDPKMSLSIMVKYLSQCDSVDIFINI